MDKPVNTAPHLFIGALLSLALVLVYALDGLTTWSFWGQGTETNPLVNAIPFEHYPLFTALRALVALVILWVFLPRSLEETLSNPTPIKMMVHPLPYQKGFFLLPIYFLFYLIIIKITAALSNSALVLWGEPILLTWREAAQKGKVLQLFSLWGAVILFSHFFAQGVLYWLWKQSKVPSTQKGNPMKLFEIFQNAKKNLSEDFATLHQKLFSEDHLNNLAYRIERFFREGLPLKPPAPHLPEEIIRPLDEPFAPFQGPLQKWDKKESDSSLPEEFARAFEKAGCKNLLLLLGQRITPASLQDHRAIPPTHEELIESATKKYKQGLTEVGRAWTKHAPRSQDAFWGTPKGSPDDKNQDSLAIVEKILAGVTWWNVFGHFQHERVFEARLPSGHGVRWTGDGKLFIGFLEPFDTKKGF